MTRHDFKVAIREKIRVTAPGLMEALDIICVRKIGVECIRAFLERPDKFRDILLEIYGGSIDSVLYITFSLFVKPLFKSDDDQAWNLARLFMDNPMGFMEIVKKILESENKIEDPLICIK